MLTQISTGRPFGVTSDPLAGSRRSAYRRTVEDYAEASGLPPFTIRDLCSGGEIKAIKKHSKGRRWYIHDEEFEKIA